MMKADTLVLIPQSIQLETAESESNIWIYVALFAGIILLFLYLFLFHKKGKTKKQQLKEKILSENEVDFSNIVNSSFHAKELYDELKGKCHPDKFNDEAMNIEATEIFQLLVKHRYNYKMLQELKKRAEKNLKI